MVHEAQEDRHIQDVFEQQQNQVDQNPVIRKRYTMVKTNMTSSMFDLSQMTVKDLREIPEIKGTQVLCETQHTTPMAFACLQCLRNYGGRTIINSGAVMGELT